MSRTSRIVALVAVLALPVAALVATLLLSTPDAPRETPVVRIGESASATPPSGDTPSPSTRPTGEPSTTKTPTKTPTMTRLPPPPPVNDDDDDDDGGHDRDDDDD